MEAEITRHRATAHPAFRKQAHLSKTGFRSTAFFSCHTVAYSLAFSTDVWSGVLRPTILRCDHRVRMQLADPVEMVPEAQRLLSSEHHPWRTQPLQSFAKFCVLLLQLSESRLRWRRSLPITTSARHSKCTMRCSLPPKAAHNARPRCRNRFHWAS